MRKGNEMILDAIISLAGIVVPPVFDFIKKKFVKNADDTPEATMSALATTKPEVLAAYTSAVTEYTKAQAAYFNRDVVGQLPIWVSALRATIRPTVVVVGLIHLTLHGLYGSAVVLDDGIRLFYEANISAWFGTRLTK